MSGLLRVEAGVLALALVAGLWLLQPPWWLVIVLLIAPDLSLLGMLGSPRVRAWSYNIAHSLIGPVLLLALAWATYYTPLLWAAGLWALHIMADRVIGFGLKRIPRPGEGAA